MISACYGYNFRTNNIFKKQTYIFINRVVPLSQPQGTYVYYNYIYADTNKKENKCL